MKVVTVIGARPQFVKAAVVSRIIAKTPGITEVLVHTGQHFDDNMNRVFFDEMQIPDPDYYLGVHGLSHGAMTGRMLEKIEEVLTVEQPDWVLVYGDTNSTLAGALAAKKLSIPVAHVEAGLRSFNMQMPEEVNRIVTDRLSDVLFCPTETAVENLQNEAFTNFPCKIVQCGDVMFDAARYYSQRSAQCSTVLSTLKLHGTSFALCTLHRQENTDDPVRLRKVVEALNAIHRELQIVLPLHPRTRTKLEAFGLRLDVTVIDPVGYFDMIELLQASQIILTDSGGLQKEAYFFGKYCITMRRETEWTELVTHGVNGLCDDDYECMRRHIAEYVGKNMTAYHLYGDGNAGEIIVKTLREQYVNDSKGFNNE